MRDALIIIVGIICATIVIMGIIVFVYKDAQAGKQVNVECIKAGGRAGFDVKNDGLGPQRGCIFT